MKEIILVGGGGHSKSVIDIIEQQKKFKIAGIIDNNLTLGSNILTYEVIGSDKDLEMLFNRFKYALITIGQIKSSDSRKKLFKHLKKIGYELPRIVSPRSYISKHSSIGEGSVIMHDVLINSNVLIGDNCIINSKALIEHDSSIKSHCHISTNATINGNVIVGENSFIGSCAVLKEGVQVEQNSFIKALSIFK